MLLRPALLFVCAFAFLWPLSVRAVPIPQEKPQIKLAQIADIKPAPAPLQKPIGVELSLSDRDRKLYREIFALQERGEWEAANDRIALLSDLRLRGVYLYQRYMHATEWVSSYDELYGWLRLYPDQAGADDIYSLASKRHEAGKPYPPQNIEKRLIRGMMSDLSPYAPAYYSTKRRTSRQEKEVRTLTTRIQRDLRRTAPTRAYRRLRDERAADYLDAVEYDRLRANIAASYLYVGKLDLAEELSVASLKRSGEKAPRAGWVAGLTAWRLGDYIRAYERFQTVALSSYASTWTRAAGAYWTSRAAMKTGRFREVSYWLNIAADHDRTFYGLLAVKALQRDVNFNWAKPAYTKAHKALLEQYPQARRAMLLVQAGQPHLAGHELIRLHPENDGALKEALIAFALYEELPGFALRFAYKFRPAPGLFYDAALYPLGAWAPEGGYQVDKALMHAIILQESKFDNRAENPVSRAMGLMQILPSTANGVMGTDRFSYRGRHALKDPVTNLTVGQTYLLRLMRRAEVGSNPFFLFMAYNAGPGNLRRWQRELADIDDILLFVEMIPFAETRAYVERVMSNYWIYRMRMGQPTPTLEDTIAGNMPRLASIDDLR